MRRVCAAFITISALAACTSAAPRLAGPTISIGGAETLPLPGAWTRLQDGPVHRGERLTRLGSQMDLIWLAEGLRPGQRIVEASLETRDGPFLEAIDGASVEAFALASLQAAGYGYAAPGDTVDLVDGKWSLVGEHALRTHSGLTHVARLNARQRGERIDLLIFVTLDAPASVQVARDMAEIEAGLQ